MSSEAVISVRNVSKAYRIWRDPSARLKAPLIDAFGQLLPASLRPPWLKRRLIHGDHPPPYYRDFHALHKLSFEVHKGEAIGVIGRNGSGKSTLLQIITGTLRATCGEVSHRGRIAALLELGSGFNPDFTGRENAILNASILGLDQAEIEERLPCIIAFAEIGDFIDQPVKTYSSGMLMRLAFSVQMEVRPDVLIVDEALAVGDMAFVAKCVNRVGEFLREGGTLLFVSHDISLVRQLTQKCLYLENGHAICFDQTAIAVSAYQARITESSGPAETTKESYASPKSPWVITNVHAKSGSVDLERLPPGSALEIELDLTAQHRSGARLVFSIYNYMGLLVVSQEWPLPEDESGARLLARLKLPQLRLSPGPYRCNFAVRYHSDILSWRRNAVLFTLIAAETETYIYREDVELEIAHV